MPWCFRTLDSTYSTLTDWKSIMIHRHRWLNFSLSGLEGSIQINHCMCHYSLDSFLRIFPLFQLADWVFHKCWRAFELLMVRTAWTTVTCRCPALHAIPFAWHNGWSTVAIVFFLQITNKVKCPQINLDPHFLSAKYCNWQDLTPVSSLMLVIKRNLIKQKFNDKT